MLLFLRYCVSLVVVLLICLSLFATDALALEQNVIEQSKNNSDLPKSSLNNTKVLPDVLKTPSPEVVKAPHPPLVYPKLNMRVVLKACMNCTCKPEINENDFCLKCCGRHVPQKAQ